MTEHLQQRSTVQLWCPSRKHAALDCEIQNAISVDSGAIVFHGQEHAGPGGSSAERQAEWPACARRSGEAVSNRVLNEVKQAFPELSQDVHLEEDAGTIDYHRSAIARVSR
jgi:hypothetical protein